MTNTQNRAALVAVSALALACICGCSLIRGYHEAWSSGIEQAARRVGVEPTLNGLADYIIESVEVGMSRSEVEQCLAAITPFEVTRGTLHDSAAGWGTVACDHIRLRLTPLPGHHWRIVACYDSMGGLVHMESLDPDFPLLGIDAPIE